MYHSFVPVGAKNAAQRPVNQITAFCSILISAVIFLSVWEIRQYCIILPYEHPQKCENN